MPERLVDMWLLKLLSRLPLRILYGFSTFLFFVSYHLVKYRRKLVRKNLRSSFPNKSEVERQQIERQFYRNLCDYAVETLKLLTISKEELAKRMSYTNPELMGRLTAQGHTVLLLSSHHFNWEWLLVSGSISLPAPIDFVYQPVKNAFFNEVTQMARTRFGAYAVKRNDIAREIIKRRDRIRGIAIVADQYPGHGNDKRYFTQFLNQETAFFYGSQQMAMLTQAPVLYAVVRRIKRGHYTCTLVEVGKPPYSKTDESVVANYANEVEKVIVERPSEWLWSHNRWKNKESKKKLGLVS